MHWTHLARAGQVCTYNPQLKYLHCVWNVACRLATTITHDLWVASQHIPLFTIRLHTQTHTDRHTQTDTHRHTQTDTHRHTHRHTHTQTQTDRQTDRQTHTHCHQRLCENPSSLLPIPRNLFSGECGNFQTAYRAKVMET